MSFAQRLFTKILPKSWADSMKADSMSWLVQCSNCQYERSIWEIGGIRWKAKGNPSMLMDCPNCNQRNWHKVYKQSNSY